LASRLPGGEKDQAIHLDHGATVGQALDRLNITADEPKIIFVNGVHAGLERALTDGDRLAVFPPIAGG
jgi:molybdopterin converting factor small subunit